LNNKKKKLIIGLFFVIAISSAVAYLLRLITAKVAFPILFSCIGCQQIFNGLIFYKKNKSLGIVSLSVGGLAIIFTIFIVIPTYYFK